MIIMIIISYTYNYTILISYRYMTYQARMRRDEAAYVTIPIDEMRQPYVTSIGVS